MANKGLHLATIGHVRGLLTDATDLVDLAKARAHDPTVFDGAPPFVWEAEISNSLLDFYKTRMHESTLKNFADGATAGVSYLHSHMPWEYIGRSLRGTYEPTAETDEAGVQIARTFAAVFTIPGRKFGTMATDDFIAGVRAGILFDVSVGFYADDIRCGICGGEMFAGWFGIYGRECSHVPGLEYPVLDSQGNEVIGADGEPLLREAFAWVYDGTLSEISTVHDGATPEADVVGVGPLKARLMAEAGKLDRHQADSLDQMFRMRLPRPRGGWAGATPTVEEDARMAGRKPTQQRAEAEAETPTPAATEETPVVAETPEAEAVVEETTVDLDALLGEEDEADEADDDGEERATPTAAATDDVLAGERARFAPHNIAIGRDPVKAVRALAQTIVALAPDAAQGRRYKSDLIDEAVKAGIRAKGAEFKETAYRAMLKGLDVDGIKTLRDDWLDEGDHRLAGTDGKGNLRTMVGGRLTRETDERAEPPAEEPKPATPDRAFAG